MIYQYYINFYSYLASHYNRLYNSVYSWTFEGVITYRAVYYESEQNDKSLILYSIGDTLGSLLLHFFYKLLEVYLGILRPEYIEHFVYPCTRDIDSWEDDKCQKLSSMYEIVSCVHEGVTKVWLFTGAPTSNVIAYEDEIKKAPMNVVYAMVNSEDVTREYNLFYKYIKSQLKIRMLSMMLLDFKYRQKVYTSIDNDKALCVLDESSLSEIVFKAEDMYIH